MDKTFLLLGVEEQFPQSTETYPLTRCMAFTQINSEVTQLQQVHIDLTRYGFFGLGGKVHSITFYNADQKQEKIVCKSNCRL